MSIESVNPATGERIETYQAHDAGAVDGKLERAVAAFREWGRAPAADRARVLARAAEILERDKATFARLMTREMGKLLVAAEQEAEKCAAGCRYYAENAEAFLRPERSDREDGRDAVFFQPL